MSKAALDRLVEHLRDGVISTHAHRGDETAVIDRSLIRSACLWLRDTEGLEFNMLSDLTAVDYYTMGREPRFEVVYHLHSLTLKQRLRVKVGVPEEDPVVDTVCDIFTDAFIKSVGTGTPAGQQVRS